MSFDALFHRPSEFRLTPKTWNQRFASPRGTNAQIPSLYQCRPFYGLHAPNNLVRRFRLLAEQAEFAENDRAAKPAPVRPTSGGEVDRRILEWGRYAESLVEANGGWESFFKRASTGDLRQLERSTLFAEQLVGQKSLIQFILDLDSGRYVQVLAGPVSVLWPIWLLRVVENPRELLQEVKRPTLPRTVHDLAIDISTHVGQHEGLPYPFGFADDVALGSRGSAEAAGEATLRGDPWSQTVLRRVISALELEYWSPPVLFATRAEIIDPMRAPRAPASQPTPGRGSREAELPNPCVVYLGISHPIETFAGVYVHVDAEKRTGKVAYEPGSWGQEAVERLHEPEAKRFTVDRRGWFADALPSDVGRVLTYFPAELSLIASENSRFYRLPEVDIHAPASIESPNVEEIDIRPWYYVLGETVLAGGESLVQQPGGRALVLDLGKYLVCASLLLKTRIPQDDDFLEALRRLRLARSYTSRIDRTQEVKKLADRHDVTLASLGERHTHSGAELLTRICEAMVRTFVDEPTPTVPPWAWCMLAEYVRFSAVTFSSAILAD